MEEAAQEEAEQVAGGEEGGEVLPLADKGLLLSGPGPQDGVAPGAGPGDEAGVGVDSPHQAGSEGGGRGGPCPGSPARMLTNLGEVVANLGLANFVAWVAC